MQCVTHIFIVPVKVSITFVNEMKPESSENELTSVSQFSRQFCRWNLFEIISAQSTDRFCRYLVVNASIVDELSIRMSLVVCEWRDDANKLNRFDNCQKIACLQICTVISQTASMEIVISLQVSSEYIRYIEMFSKSRVGVIRID